MDAYDVIIIGTGAGGGALAPRPGPRPGKRILLLERGNWLPREKENWDPRARCSSTSQLQHTEGSGTTTPG